MKTNAPVATKTWQLAMTIDGNDMASWGYNSKNWISTRTFNDRANSSKSSYFNAPASQIKLVMSGGLSKSITITPTGRVRSLHQIFNGAFSATHTIKSQWLLVDGAVASQNSCNRQGFNLIVAAGNKAEERRARLGLIMNQENDCDTPDTSIGIGFSDTGNGKVVAGATCDCCAEKGLCKNVGTVAHVYVKPISAQAVSKCVLSACTENGHADNDCCGKTGVTGCKPGYRHSLVQFPVNKAPNGFYQHCNVARAGYTGSTCCQPFTADVCVTTLCSDADLKGNCCSVKGTVNDFYKKTPECAAVGNDRVSSVHLTKGCEVTLCQNDCGNGPQWTFAGPKTINAKGPGSFANDQISSLIVAQMEPPSQN